MINPEDIIITRLPDKDGQARFEASLKMHHVRSTSLELLADTSKAEEIMQLVRLESQAAFHRTVYGELLEPFADLVSVAKHCPSCYADKMTKAVLKIGALLVPPSS